MKKITFLCIFILTAYSGFAQNVFTDGTFDDPSAWTVIQQNGNNNAMATIADGVAKFDVVDATAGWGAEGHVAIYKAFTVDDTGFYQFDADVITDGLGEHWFELYVGTTIPIDGSEYNTDDFGAVNLLALSTWDCSTFNTYSGSWLTTNCKSLDGTIELDTGTTYYALVRTGGINWGTGVILDNLTLVSAEAPPASITELTVDFETASEFGAADGASYTDLTANTVTDGINASAFAGQISDCNSTWWSHALLNTSGFDLSSGDRGFSLMVKGDRATPIMLKLQVGDNHGVNHEVNGQEYTTPGVWQKITWDLSEFDTMDRTRLVLFFNVQSDTNTGGATDTFQFDNLVFGAFASLSTKDFQIEGLSTYPNPTIDSWNVSTKNQVITSIEVFSVLGNSVLRILPNAESVEVDTSGLTPGIYITEISTALGTETKKLIK
jgi:hypothetical protein